MNKSQLVMAVSESEGISLDQAEKLLTIALDSITTTLAKGDSISFIGFGKFGVKKRSARKVRNPQNGQEMMLEPALVPFFKAGKNLKEQVDSK